MTDLEQIPLLPRLTVVERALPLLLCFAPLDQSRVIADVCAEQLSELPASTQFRTSVDNGERALVVLNHPPEQPTVANQDTTAAH